MAIRIQLVIDDTKTYFSLEAVEKKRLLPRIRALEMKTIEFFRNETEQLDAIVSNFRISSTFSSANSSLICKNVTIIHEFIHLNAPCSIVSRTRIDYTSVLCAFS